MDPKCEQEREGLRKEGLGGNSIRSHRRKSRERKWWEMEGVKRERNREWEAREGSREREKKV